jgi:hypothetical protein
LGNFTPYPGTLFIQKGEVITGNTGGPKQGFSHLGVIALEQRQKLVTDSISQW